MPPGLREDWSLGDAGEAEDALVALDFSAGAKSFLEIVGKFYGGAAVGIVELADQAEGIEIHATVRIAIAEIVGQERAPAGAETNAAAGGPLFPIEKVAGLAEIGGSVACVNFPGEMGVQGENSVGVEAVGGYK